MYRDVVDLREFYQTSLGQVALRQLKRRIREFWPDLTGQSVLGIGYATPYLRPFIGEAERVIAVMPSTQGVVFWPPEGPGLTTLSDESSLPFDDLSFAMTESKLSRWRRRRFHSPVASVASLT